MSAFGIIIGLLMTLDDTYPTPLGVSTTVKAAHMRINPTQALKAITSWARLCVLSEVAPRSDEVVHGLAELSMELAKLAGVKLVQRSTEELEFEEKNKRDNVVSFFW